MNFFLMKWFIDKIKSGEPIMYYNIETTVKKKRNVFLTHLTKMKNLY